MKVRVKFMGIAQVPRGFEAQREVPMDFPGNSLEDLFQQLFSGMDSESRRILFTEQGEISPYLAIVVNGIAVFYSKGFNPPLKEGDLIELISACG